MKAKEKVLRWFHTKIFGGISLDGKSRFSPSLLLTRSVFANDKFVKLKQDVTRQRERDLRNENASLNIFLNFKRERDYSLI